MKKLLAAALLVLAGCDTTGALQRDVVVRYEYITRKATDQQKAIPPYPPKINIATASQTDLAEWIALSEQRQWAMESIIKELVSFYEKPYTQAEVKAEAAADAASAATTRVTKAGR